METPRPSGCPPAPFSGRRQGRPASARASAVRRSFSEGGRPSRTALPGSDRHPSSAAMTLNTAPVALAEQLHDVNSITPERKDPVHDPPLAGALERQTRSTPWTVGHGSQLYFAPMASRRLDAGIDNLYQLPLGEFTAARNALA